MTPDPSTIVSFSAQDLVTHSRDVAEKWTTAIGGLYGIFGVSSLVFIDDPLAGMAPSKSALFGIFVVGAILLAALSMYSGTKAAHGWPPKVAEPEERRSDATRLLAIRDDTKLSVKLAGGALTAVVAAMVTLWIPAGAEDPKPLSMFLVHVENNFKCGAFENSNQNELILRTSTGGTSTTDSVRWEEILRIDLVSACP